MVLLTPPELGYALAVQQWIRDLISVIVCATLGRHLIGLARICLPETGAKNKY